ncbi:MAG: PqqD family protein [Bacteroidota bacterium]
MNIFQRRKILKNENGLELIPIRRHEHEMDEEGKVKLVVPKFNKKWMQKFFIAPAGKKTVNIQLDEMGSAVWLRIDGEKTVEKIAGELINNYPDTEEAQDRVLSFISMLYEQRYITFRQLEEQKKRNNNSL